MAARAADDPTAETPREECSKEFLAAQCDRMIPVLEGFARIDGMDDAEERQLRADFAALALSSAFVAETAGFALSSGLAYAGAANATAVAIAYPKRRR